MKPPHDNPQGLLVIPHLRIQNANAISSPMTHGFPAMSAFLGLMWALDRKMAQADIALVPEKIGVICHWHEEQVQDGYVKTFRLTRNPVDKDGDTAAIVEEGRIHLDVTLVFQVHGGKQDSAENILFSDDAKERQRVAWQVRELIEGMRVAGGSVLPAQSRPGRRIAPQLYAWPSDEQGRHDAFRRLCRQCLPGFALVGRDDLLARHWQTLHERDGDASLLDAWLDLARFNFRSQIAGHTISEPSVKGDEHAVTRNVQWQHDRPADAGWLVPIPVGYAALTPLQEAGSVRNARDVVTPFRFVESVYSLGQWISPHRLRNVQDMLWYADHQAGQGLYRCCNDYLPPPQDDDDTPSAASAFAVSFTSDRAEPA